MRNLSLTVRRGEIFGFLGPNGAGKSTSIKMLLGLVQPSGGQAFVLGIPSSDVEVRRKIGFLPEDPVTLVRINGAVQVAAGMMLSFGILRRTAAVLLIGSLVPTTVAGHPFWEDLDEDVRAQHLTQFFKNLGLLGGLVLVATEGREGSNRRARTRARGAMVRTRPR